MATKHVVRFRFLMHCLALAGLALLSTTSSGQPAPSRGAVAVDLPAQPLGQSLNGLAQILGVQIAAPGDLVAGKTAPPLAGRFTAEEALTQLLIGSGLEARREGAGYVVRRTAAPVTTPGRPAPLTATPPAPSGAPSAQAAGEPRPELQLPDVVVTGSVSGESAWGPVKGYVATQGATGTRTDTPLIETPQSLSIVTADQMRDQGAQSVPQALRYTSGIIPEQRGVNEAALEYLFARGFQVEEYQDGLKLPPVTLRFAVPTFDTYSLERVEFLHGPASALYGQGFPGGTVNLISKRPTATPFYEVSLQTGNFGRMQGAFDAGGPLDPNGHFLYRLTGLGLSTDTQINFDQQQRLFIAPAFTWQPTRDTSLTFLSYYNNQPNAGSYNLLPSDAVFNNPNGTLQPSFQAGDPIFDRHNQSGYAVGYVFDHRFDDTWSVHQIARYTQTWDYIRGYFADSLQPNLQTLNRFAFFQDESVKVVGVDTWTQAKFQTGPIAHKAIAGVDYLWIDYQDTGAFDFSPEVPSIDIFNPVYNQPFPVPAPTIREDFVSTQVGLYVQDQLSLYGFNLLVGGRYDWVSSRDRDLIGETTERQNDQKFTWRVGLTYLFDNGIAPYFSAVTSFQPEAGADFLGATFKPTTGTQYELGVRYQPKGWNAMFTAAIYQLTQNNVITPDPEHPTFSVQTGQVRSRGIELAAHVSLADGFRAVGAYTFLDQTVTQSNGPDLGKRLAGMPQNTASLWLDYTLPAGGWWSGFGAGAGVRYVGSSPGDAQNTFDVPGYTLADLGVRYDFGALTPMLKGARAAVNVQNLLDKHYVASCIGSLCSFGLERTIYATVTYRW